MDLTIILFSFFRCVDFVAELSQNPKAQKEVISLIPLVAQAAHFKHYTQHLHLLETVCTQVTNFMMAMLLYCGCSKVLIIIYNSARNVLVNPRQETLPREKRKAELTDILDQELFYAVLSFMPKLFQVSHLFQVLRLSKFMEVS